MWKEGNAENGKRQMHVVKGEHLQKEVCTEERKCFTEANT